MAGKIIKSEELKQEAEMIKCGIIMPLSPIDGCTAEHWLEVMEIIKSSVANVGFEASMVSDAADTGVIHKRIVQNIYENPIVVCDLSCKNPNVMFELGMRLAFDKPTVLIQDDKTGPSFDVSAIEYLQYPRDMNYHKIEQFKEKLADKVRNTLEAAKNPEYTTFLKHFGTFKVAEITTEVIGKDDFIIEQLQRLTAQVDALNVNKRILQPIDNGEFLRRLRCIVSGGGTNIPNLTNALRANPMFTDVSLTSLNSSYKYSLRYDTRFHSSNIIVEEVKNLANSFGFDKISFNVD